MPGHPLTARRPGRNVRRSYHFARRGFTVIELMVGVAVVWRHKRSQAVARLAAQPRD